MRTHEAAALRPSHVEEALQSLIGCKADAVLGNHFQRIGCPAPVEAPQALLLKAMMSAHCMQQIRNACSNTLHTPPIFRPGKCGFKTLNSAHSQVMIKPSPLQIMLSGRLLRGAPALQSEFISLLPSARCSPWRRPGRGTCRRASASAAALCPGGSRRRMPAGPRPPPAQGCAPPWCCSTLTKQLRAFECSDSIIEDCKGAAAPRAVQALTQSELPRAQNVPCHGCWRGEAGNPAWHSGALVVLTLCAMKAQTRLRA